MESSKRHNLQKLATQKLTHFKEAVACYRLEDAEELFEDLRGFYEQLGDQRTIAPLASQLGCIEEMYMAYEKAGGYYKEAMEIYAQLGDLNEAAEQLVKAGNAELSQGHNEAAKVLYMRAVDNFTQTGNLERAQSCLRWVMQWTNRAESEGLFYKLLELLEQMGNKDELNKCRRSLILFLDEIGKEVEAANLLEATLVGCIQEEDSLWAANFKVFQVTLEKRHGRSMNAEHRLQEALDLYTQENALQKMAAMKRKIAVLAVQRSDWDKAERLFGESATLYDEIARKNDSLNSRFLQATVPALRVEASEAPELLAQAYFIGIETNLKWLSYKTEIRRLVLDAKGMTISETFNMRRFNLFPTAVLVTFAENGENVVREQLREIGMPAALIEQMLAPLT